VGDHANPTTTNLKNNLIIAISKCIDADQRWNTVQINEKNSCPNRSPQKTNPDIAIRVDCVINKKTKT
jgi:hypothetical protein